ncbi:MAG: exo-alpha-sialidase, partial [Armatimonadetes bacterium]|nr:exo-alpha-sialidase [Armatimonadota bacterium]
DGSAWQRDDAGLTGPVSALAWSDGLLAITDGAKGQPGGVWKRAPAGWQRLDQTPFAASLRGLATAPGDPRRLYVAARDEYIAPTFWPGGLYGSTDGGASWKRLFTDRFVACVAVDPRDSQHVVVGTNDHPYHDEPLGRGVHESRDGGATWHDITDNLALPNIACLAFDAKGRMLAGTGGCSLWWRN